MQLEWFERQAECGLVGEIDRASSVFCEISVR
jgi:hypothetical protein